MNDSDNTEHVDTNTDPRQRGVFARALAAKRKVRVTLMLPSHVVEAMKVWGNTRNEMVAKVITRALADLERIHRENGY